jgi:hypothetical protein
VSPCCGSSPGVHLCCRFTPQSCVISLINRVERTSRCTVRENVTERDQRAQPLRLGTFLALIAVTVEYTDVPCMKTVMGNIGHS